MSTNLSTDHNKKKKFLLKFLETDGAQGMESAENEASDLMFDSDIPEGVVQNPSEARKNAGSRPPELNRRLPIGAEPDAPRTQRQPMSMEPRPVASTQSAQTPRLMKVLIDGGVVTYEQVKQALEIQKTS